MSAAADPNSNVNTNPNAGGPPTAAISTAVPVATPTLTTSLSTTSQAVSTSPTTPTTEWACDKCTFVNKVKDPKCTVCNEGSRPASASPTGSGSGAAAAGGASPAASGAAAAAAAASSGAPNTKEAESSGDGGDDGGDEPAKKRSSYYFFASTPKEQQAQYAPKPIDPATAAAPPMNRVGSAWNTAGTWEDRDVTKLAKSRLREIFEKGVEVPAADFPNGSIRFVSCTKCEGEASLVMARGKKKLGFELHVTIQFKGTYKGAEVDGTVDIPDLEDTTHADGDYQFNVSCATSEVKSFVRSAKCQGIIRKTIDSFVNDLKNH